MKWYKYTLRDLLNEPICVVNYLFQYCEYWERMELEKLMMTSLGSLKAMA